MKAHGKAIKRTVIVPMLICIGAVFMSCMLACPAHAYENIVIVIDPGHGGPGMEGETDSGARYNGVMEKDVDLITAMALVEELSQYGNLTVYMTRTEDVHMELQDRVDFAKSVNADYLISIHYNASVHHRFYGSEIFTSAFGEEYAKGVSLAQTIMSWWVEDGAVSKGVKTRIGKKGDYYGIIRMGREAGIPTIILEHGYLDIDSDFAKYGTEDAWRHMGVLDATAIADYFGVKKGVVQANVEAKLTVPVPTGRVDDDQTPPENVSVTIDHYDPATRVLKYTVTATEPDSMLLYYDLNTQTLAEDEDNGFMKMSVWENGAESMQGTYTVPDGYNGAFVARVYNNYEKFTDTEPITIPAEFLPKEDNADTDAVPGDPSHMGGDGTAITSMPQVTLQDGSGATWTLEGALAEAKGAAGLIVDHDGINETGKKHYAGMIIAIVVAVSMLVAAIAMAVVTSSRSKRKRRRPDRYDRYIK